MSFKILMVIGSLDYCNGITSYAMNYYEKLRDKDYEIDFAVHYNFDSVYKKRILDNGNNVYFMGDFSLKSMSGLRKRIRKLYSRNNYDIIHCHILNVAYFYFKEAEKKNISCRILHSHATRNSDKKLKNFRNYFLKKLALKYTTTRFACSKYAGDYLYGTERQYYVIRNAIDYSRFSFQESWSQKIKKDYAIQENELVLGFVGRFTAQKNLSFLLNIFKGLRDISFDFKGFIIGDGEQKDMIVRFISENKLEENIIVLESRTDIYEFYSVFDILLLPSIFEGLPVTAVEAQVSGCKVYCSSTITKELNFTNQCVYLPIENVEPWVKKIVAEPLDRRHICVVNDYNINTEAERLAKLYGQLLERCQHE